MKNRVRELALFAAGLVIGAVVAAGLTTMMARPVPNATAQSVSQPDSTTQRCLNTLLAATAAEDYGQFVSVGDDRFRQGITQGTFQLISQGLAPKMRRGYTATYLGQLQQSGAPVFLWRLTFADGDDDRLVRMSMSQDRVDGFLITPAF